MPLGLIPHPFMIRSRFTNNSPSPLMTYRYPYSPSPLLALYCFVLVSDCLQIYCPASKRESDVMFCLQGYQGLTIDRSLLYWSYPQDRINTQVNYRFPLAQMECKVSVLLNNCRQNITSLSLLVGTTVAIACFVLQ